MSERETRPLAAPIASTSEVGRSRDLIACPFCSAHVWTFTWSRCGRGKRCQCGALLCRAQAYAPVCK